MALANSPFPCIRIDVLPAAPEPAAWPLPTPTSTWLTKTGDSVVLTVAQPGGLILFTTYRPSDYATTGIRMDIKRRTGPAAGSHAPAPPMQPSSRPCSPAAAHAAVGAGGLSYSPTGGQPRFWRYPGQPQAAPAFAHPRAFTPPQPGFAQPARPSANPRRPSANPRRPSPIRASFGQSAPSFGQPAPSFEQPAPAGAPTAPDFHPAKRPRRPHAGGAHGRHLEGEGDWPSTRPGRGRPGSKRRLEAAALYVEGVALQDLQYAAIGADGSPWPG